MRPAMEERLEVQEHVEQEKKRAWLEHGNFTSRTAANG